MRGAAVPGVQAWALPISSSPPGPSVPARELSTAVDSSRAGTLGPGGEEGAEPRLGHLRAEPLHVVVIFKQAAERLGEDGRSEERRVGKEWRCRWSPYH